jgi:hypothetical protein
MKDSWILISQAPVIGTSWNRETSLTSKILLKMNYSHSSVLTGLSLPLIKFADDLPYELNLIWSIKSKLILY